MLFFNNDEVSNKAPTIAYFINLAAKPLPFLVASRF